jgi:hypothetical protein
MKRMIMMFAVAMCCMAAIALAETTVVGFDGGDSGGFTGNATFEAAGGNPDGAAYHLGFLFFNVLRTGGVGEPVNESFVRDYSSYSSVTFSFDIKTNSLTDFIGNQIVRSVGVSLMDRDNEGPSGAAGVFFEVGLVSQAENPEWTTYSVTIDDPMSADLPDGWIGFGDEDPNTFQPRLPEGVTFADVLAGVDQFEITGAVPGFFYTDANFDVLIDNVTVTVEEGSVRTETTSWSALKAEFK